ncbi:MalY/PatB family protein [Paenibacillus sp. HJGM_3]|uniref:MalY/PatB family protein n=1 Tax=Paenibacillus sp. HJGM_3 TaxID=3379816 RepID=UPI00386BC735
MNFSFDEIIDMSETGSIKWGMIEKFFGEKGLTPMWVADMDFRGPAAVIEALKRRVELGIFGYTGRTDSLVEAVAGWMYRRHHWRVKKEWICYSPGVVSALNACVQSYTVPGDRVIIQPPVYPPFFDTVRANGRELVLNPLILANGRYEMDFDDLRKKAKTSQAKMLILCSPHNPIGRVWTQGELEQLAQICIEHDLIIVSDEIHSDLVFKPFKHIPLTMADPRIESRTIVCMAPSKTFNMAGLASSFIVIPDPQLRETFNAFMEKAHLTLINPFSLTAADAAYRYGDEWLEQVLNYIKGNVDYLIEFVNQQIPQLSVIRPEGTYLAWIDCRALGFTPDALQNFMWKQAKVALNAGTGFGEEGGGFMRMNLAAPRPVLEEALSKIESAIRTL